MNFFVFFAYTYKCTMKSYKCITKTNKQTQKKRQPPCLSESSDDGIGLPTISKKRDIVFKHTKKCVKKSCGNYQSKKLQSTLKRTITSAITGERPFKKRKLNTNYNNNNNQNTSNNNNSNDNNNAEDNTISDLNNDLLELDTIEHNNNVNNNVNHTINVTNQNTNNATQRKYKSKHKPNKNWFDSSKIEGR